MEYLPGGELFDRIVEHDGYGEKQASHIIKQVLSALYEVHKKKICHLDLKPDNIIFKDETESCVKLIDFGMSRMIPKLTLLKGKNIGTIQYMAPEIITGKGFGLAADVWSTGVILYCMIFGYPPFYDDNDDEEIGDMVSSEERIQNKILKGFDPTVKEGYGPFFPSEMPVSDECMKLISHMLEIDAAKRWTVKECLSSKWITQQGADNSDNKISPLFRDSLMKYTKKNKFRIAISNLFNNYLDIDVKDEIVKHFNEMDTNKDGKLSLKEFEDGLKKLNDQISSEQIELIFKSLDFDNDLTISLNELITSTNITSLTSRDERLYAAFEKLDTNHDGRIDKTEMEMAAKMILKQNKKSKEDEKDEQNNDEEDDDLRSPSPQTMITLRRLKSAFNEADTNNDGTIDYDEFLAKLHPEFKDDGSDNFAKLQRMSSIQNSSDGAKFNVTNTVRTGLLLHPKSYSGSSLGSNDNLLNNNKEIDELRKELKQTKDILSKNVTKVYNLQNELTQKDKTIDSLNNTLNERNEELKRLRELLKSLQTQNLPK